MAEAREPWLDSARFWLVGLVVLVHVLEPMRTRSVLAAALLLCIWTLLMPSITLISGHVSSARLDRRRLGRLLSGLVLPYLVFQALFQLLQHLLEGSWTLHLSLAVPWWHLWYLVSLVLWRLALPWLQATRAPLLVSVLLGLAGGWAGWVGAPLALARTLALLPFFVLGHQLSRSQLLGLTRWRWAGVALLALGLGAGALLHDHLAWLELVQHRVPYRAMGWSAWQGPLVRGGIWLLSLVGCLAFLSVVPQGPRWTAPLGARTLVSYVLHLAPVLVLLHLAVAPRLSHFLGPELATGALVLVAAAIHLLLVTPPAWWLSRPFLAPRGREVLAGGGVLLFLVGLELWPGSLTHPHTPVLQARGLSDCAPTDQGLALAMDPEQRGRTLRLGLRPGAAYELILFGGNLPVAREELAPQGRGELVTASTALPPRARNRGVELVWIRGEGGCVGSVELTD